MILDHENIEGKKKKKRSCYYCHWVRHCYIVTYVIVIVIVIPSNLDDIIIDNL